MNIQDLNQKAEELKKLALATVRYAIPEKFNFRMETLLSFYDDESGNYINVLASGGFKRDGKVYLYGREFGTDKELAEAPDEWFPIEQFLNLLTAYEKRNEEPEEFKGLPQLDDDLGSLMSTLIADGQDYYLKIVTNGQEKIYGPFNRQKQPKGRVSDLRGHSVWFRVASESIWREIRMAF